MSELLLLQTPDYVAILGTHEGALLDVSIADNYAEQSTAEPDMDDTGFPETATSMLDFTILSHTSQFDPDDFDAEENSDSTSVSMDISEEVDLDPPDKEASTVGQPPSTQGCQEVGAVGQPSSAQHSGQEAGAVGQPPSSQQGDDEVGAGVQPLLAPELLQGYCIVGDNIDANIHPRHQTLVHQTHSLHMFHSMVALDRINLLGLSDELPFFSGNIDADTIMPEQLDMDRVLFRCNVIISR